MDGDSVDDISLLAPTPAVKVAAACTLLSGLLGVVLALQAGALLEARGAYRLSEPVFGLLGLVELWVGYRLSRMRGRAALMSAIASGLLALAALVWFGITLMNGVFVFLALVLMPVASVATIGSLASLKVTARADAARLRLREQGLDAGL